MDPLPFEIAALSLGAAMVVILAAAFGGLVEIYRRSNISVDEAEITDIEWVGSGEL